MEKILTIIIPTYNMEKYLDRSLSCLIVPDAELMRQLEVIVVNDGSKDRSSEIAHGYADRYPDTYVVIDKENGNYGSCINAALPVAKGKYVRVLDADDCFDNKIFADYLSSLRSTDVDLVYNQIRNVDQDSNTLEYYAIDAEPYKVCPFESIQKDWNTLIIHGVAYKRSIFEGLHYHQSEKIYYTDLEWVYLPMSNVRNLVYFSQPLYNYYLGRPGQTVSKEVVQKQFRMIIAILNSYLTIYKEVLACNGKWHGKTISLDYLKSRCKARIERVYSFILIENRRLFMLKELRAIDQQLFQNIDELKAYSNNLSYPNNATSSDLIRVRYIKIWRKYGNFAYLVCLFFVNHYMGICNRWRQKQTI